MDRFTPSFAHQQIGDGLIDNTGQYRTGGVKPAQDDDDNDDRVYLEPFSIENKIEELFCQCREILRRRIFITMRYFCRN